MHALNIQSYNCAVLILSETPVNTHVMRTYIDSKKKSLVNTEKCSIQRDLELHCLHAYFPETRDPGSILDWNVSRDI